MLYFHYIGIIIPIYWNRFSNNGNSEEDRFFDGQWQDRKEHCSIFIDRKMQRVFTRRCQTACRFVPKHGSFREKFLRNLVRSACKLSFDVSCDDRLVRSFAGFTNLPYLRPIEPNPKPTSN